MAARLTRHHETTSPIGFSTNLWYGKLLTESLGFLLAHKRARVLAKLDPYTTPTAKTFHSASRG
jgi:hypothetical protein